MNNNINEMIVEETVMIDENGREIPVDLSNPNFYDENYKDKGVSMDENFDFLFKNGNIRYFIKDNIVWFIAKDICDYLEFENTIQAIQDNVSPFNNHHFSYSEISAGLAQIQTPSTRYSLDSYAISRNGAICINEQGIYELTLRSRMPKAKDFYRYICNSILPNIRRFGVYTSPNVRDITSSNSDYMWWVNDKIDSFNLQTESQRQLIRDIASGIADIKLPENISSSGELQAKFWQDVANTTHINTFNYCRGMVEQADKKRKAATTRASKLEKQLKEEKIRHDAVEQELRATITRLESSSGSPSKKVMCHIIPDDVRTKLSYEDYKKLKDSLNN